MDMMESESGSSVDPADEIYEENEVVWAKIHGYPWWPAFVLYGLCRLEKWRLITYRSHCIPFTFSETSLSIVFYYSLLSSRINS